MLEFSAELPVSSEPFARVRRLRSLTPVGLSSSGIPPVSAVGICKRTPGEVRSRRDWARLRQVCTGQRYSCRLCVRGHRHLWRRYSGGLIPRNFEPHRSCALAWRPAGPLVECGGSIPPRIGRRDRPHRPPSGRDRPDTTDPQYSCAETSVALLASTMARPTARWIKPRLIGSPFTPWINRLGGSCCWLIPDGYDGRPNCAQSSTMHMRLA